MTNILINSSFILKEIQIKYKTLATNPECKLSEYLSFKLVKCIVSASNFGLHPKEIIPISIFESFKILANYIILLKLLYDYGLVY